MICPVCLSPAMNAGSPRDRQLVSACACCGYEWLNEDFKILLDACDLVRAMSEVKVISATDTQEKT